MDARTTSATPPMPARATPNPSATMVSLRVKSSVKNATAYVTDKIGRVVNPPWASVTWFMVYGLGFEV